MLIEITIFNRWGNTVYTKRGYDNNDAWDGRQNGAELASGTYFYVLDDGKGKKYSGYIEINR